MTLNANSPWVKTIGIAAGLVLVAVLWAWLAGGIFLMRFGRSFDDASAITLYQYWQQYKGVPVVGQWLQISGGIALAVLLAPLGLFFAPAKKSLFGDAKLATRRDIKRAGLYGDSGLIVGRDRGRYLMFKGQQHALIAAPTRSGKGVGIVIPNLLNWPDSVVVLDIKQENWDITSGYRAKHGQACYLFNPAAADYRTHRYNPLAYINDDPNFRIDDVQKIAGMLFPDQPGTDVIWTATPRTLFMGIVLYLLETPGKPVTIGQVLRETLANGDGSAHFASIIAERASGKQPLSAACVRSLNSYVSIASENTRSGIIGGFRSKLELWMNPLVDAATSANDFDLRDVRKRRMSIYLGVTPDNMERMAPLLNLFFQQLMDLNTRELPSQNDKIKRTCLLLMDEFTAIGKIPILSKGISYIAGYWLRMMPIIQSPSQLVDVYGEHAASTFQTNHALQIVYPPKANEIKTAKEISEWLGYQTVKGTSHSKGKGLFAKKTQSESTSDQRRALMLPQEITSMPPDKELVITEGIPPILAHKVQYFQDPVFMDRLKSVSKTLRASPGTVPDKGAMDAAIRAGELAAKVPLIDVEGHQRAVEGPQSSTTTVRNTTGGKTVTTIIRAVTADDIPNLEALDVQVDWLDRLVPDNSVDQKALGAYINQRCQDAGIETSEITHG